MAKILKVLGVTPQYTKSMKVLTSLAAAFAFPLAIFPSANAAADYCMTTYKGDRMCIFATYGSRSNRGMVITVNGQHSRTEGIDCYNDSYHRTSIIAYGCWEYEGIKSDTSDLDVYPEASDSVQGIMTSSGFLSENKAIDLEKVKNALPPEMR